MSAEAIKPIKHFLSIRMQLSATVTLNSYEIFCIILILKMFLVLFKCNILKKAPQIVRILHNNNCRGFTLFVFRTMNMSANIPCIIIIIDRFI